MSNRELSLACYRTLLRWSKIWRNIPITIQKDHLKLIAPALVEAHVTISDEPSFRNVIRWCFRSDTITSHEEGHNGRELLDKALLAVKLLNTKYASQIKEKEKIRMEHLDRRGIKFQIGQVIRHKEEGYHGVIYGWDRVCKFPQYVTETNVDFVQPFYSILPDINDSTRLYGRPRLYYYIAQESMEAIEKARRITNKSISHYFDTYSMRSTRYIPKKHIRYEYPDEYMASDGKPCSNVTDKRKMYKAPTKPSGKSHGRKRGIQRSFRSLNIARHSNMDISELGVEKEEKDDDDEKKNKEDSTIKAKVEGKSKRKKDKDTDTASTTVPYTKVEGNDKFG